MNKLWIKKQNPQTSRYRNLGVLQEGSARSERGLLGGLEAGGDLRQAGAVGRLLDDLLYAVPAVLSRGGADAPGVAVLVVQAADKGVRALCGAAVPHDPHARRSAVGRHAFDVTAALVSGEVLRLTASPVRGWHGQQLTRRKQRTKHKQFRALHERTPFSWAATVANFGLIVKDNVQRVLDMLV